MRAVILFLLVLAIFLWQWSWFEDFWNHVLPQVGQQWWIKALGSLWLCGAPLLAFALLGRFLWALGVYRVVRELIHSRGENAPDRPDRMMEAREYDDVISAILALVSITLGFGLLFWILPFQWRDYWKFVQIEPLKAWVWLICFAVALFATGRVICCTLWHHFRRHHDRRLRLQTWKQFRKKHLGLAVSDLDEAITGLRTLQRGIEGQLLPRLPSPRVSDFTDHWRHLRRPERIFDRQSWMGWLWRFLLTPLHLIYHWIVTPLYNEVFAGLIDEFVWGQLHQRAFGSDICGLKLANVTDHPMGERRRAVYPQAARDCLIALTGNVTAYRKVIFGKLLPGVDTALKFDAGRFIHQAMQGKEPENGLLIHTSYFDCGAIQDAIARHISGTGNQTLVKASWPPIPSRRANGDEDQKPPYLPASLILLDAVAMLLRGLTKVAVFLAPVGLLGLISYGTIYPYSQLYHLRWAGNDGPAIELANKELSPKPTDDNFPYKAPLVVRWRAAYRLLHPQENDSSFGDKIENVPKRIVFYSRLGQKYAQLGHSEWAADAFKLALVQIRDYKDSSFEERVQYLKPIANSLFIARRYITKTDFNNILERLWNISDAFNFTEKLQVMMKDIDVDLWQEEYEWYFRFVAEDADTERLTKDVIDWCIHPGIEKDKAASIKARRLAFFLTFGRKLPCRQDQLLEKFKDVIQEIYKEANNHPDEIGKWFPPLGDVFQYVLSVGECVCGEQRRELIEWADNVNRFIGRFPNQETYKVRFTVMIEKSRRETGQQMQITDRDQTERHSIELLINAERRIASNLVYDEEQPLRQAVAGGCGRAGDYRRGRDLAENWGAQSKIEVAMQIMLHEIEKNLKSQAPSIDRFEIRHAFDQELPHENYQSAGYAPKK